MKFSVGYQLREQDDFLESIICCKECINEIYFSWGDFANGRNSQIKQSGMLPWEAQRKQKGIRLCLRKPFQGLKIG